MSSGDPATARNTTRGRFYTDPISHKDDFVSVTNVLDKAFARPALVGWGIKITAEGAVERIAQLYAILQESGPDAAVSFLKGISREKKESSKDAGKAIHRAINEIILGKPESAWPTHLAGHQAQFDRFQTEHRVVWELTETTVYNTVPPWAGTLDWIAVITCLSCACEKRWTEARLLGDTKTGGVYPEVTLQLAPYRHAEYLYTPDGERHALPEVDGCAVLQLKSDGYSLIPVRANEDDYRTFLYLYAIWHWMNGGAEGAIG